MPEMLRQDAYWMQSPDGRVMLCGPREAQELQDNDDWCWIGDGDV